jgi:hypothetical protein
VESDGDAAQMPHVLMGRKDSNHDFVAYTGWATKK